VSEDKLQEIDDALQGLVDTGELAGVTVIAARHGKVFYQQSFGQRDMGRSLPMEDDTVFRIYSMSKAITTTAAMMMYEEGEFNLEDPVSAYIPSFTKLKVAEGDTVRAIHKEMLVIDLIRHTAGLGYDLPEGNHGFTWVEDDIFDSDHNLERFVEKISKLPLHENPQSRWRYGSAIDILGRLVEIWSGQPLDTFLSERIFEPLTMVNTGFYVKRVNRSRFAVSYFKDENGALAVEDDSRKSPYLKKTKLFSGGQGLCSTTDDYMKFLVMLESGGELFGHRLLKKETVELMTKNHLPEDLMPIRFGEEMRWGVGHGLGFNVRVSSNDQWDPPGRVHEYGWGGAASTHYWISPDDGLCVITMEQIMPFSFKTESAVKHLFYEALEN
jgi:CubicO group peptidase (beta-lactamase class C family)